MFTGLIERTGRISELETSSDGARLQIAASGWTSPLKEGDAEVQIFQGSDFKGTLENSNLYLKSDIFYDGSSGTQKVRRNWSVKFAV